LHRFRGIKEGDLVAFIGPWKPIGTRGRVPLEKFKGTIEKILVFRIISDYYYDETEVWGSGTSEKWPHRFKFSKNPIMELKNINIKKLSYSSKDNLQKLTNRIFWEGNPSTLVDLISHGQNR